MHHHHHHRQQQQQRGHPQSPARRRAAQPGAPLKVRAVSASSAATPWPTRAGRRCSVPISATIARSASCGSRGRQGNACQAAPRRQRCADGLAGCCTPTPHASPGGLALTQKAASAVASRMSHAVARSTPVWAGGAAAGQQQGRMVGCKDGKEHATRQAAQEHMQCPGARAPAPTQAPCTAAMTGTGQRSKADMASCSTNTNCLRVGMGVRGRQERGRCGRVCGRWV